MSDSVRPHRRQPTRLHRPWDFPGKSTGVGCHCLLCCIEGGDTNLRPGHLPQCMTRKMLRTQLVKNLPAMQETPVRFLGWEDPLEKGYATHPSIYIYPHFTEEETKVLKEKLVGFLSPGVTCFLCSSDTRRTHDAFSNPHTNPASKGH